MEIKKLRSSSRSITDENGDWHWNVILTFITEYNNAWWDIYLTFTTEKPEQNNLRIVKCGVDEDIGHYEREVYNETGRTVNPPTDAETLAVFNAYIAQYN